MKNAIYARIVMNWKKNRSCTILEGKVSGDGLAFLQDAKRKEVERQAEEEEKIRYNRLMRQREKEKREAGLRMMRRIKRRLEGDTRVKQMAEMIRNFRDWQKEEWDRQSGLRMMKRAVVRMQGNEKVSTIAAWRMNLKAGLK